MLNLIDKFHSPPIESTTNTLEKSNVPNEDDINDGSIKPFKTEKVEFVFS